MSRKKIWILFTIGIAIVYLIIAYLANIFPFNYFYPQDKKTSEGYTIVNLGGTPKSKFLSKLKITAEKKEKEVESFNVAVDFNKNPLLDCGCSSENEKESNNEITQEVKGTQIASKRDDTTSSTTTTPISSTSTSTSAPASTSAPQSSTPSSGLPLLYPKIVPLIKSMQWFAVFYPQAQFKTFDEIANHLQVTLLTYKDTFHQIASEQGQYSAWEKMLDIYYGPALCPISNNDFIDPTLWMKNIEPYVLSRGVKWWVIDKAIVNNGFDINASPTVYYPIDLDFNINILMYPIFYDRPPLFSLLWGIDSLDSLVAAMQDYGYIVDVANGKQFLGLSPLDVGIYAFTTNPEDEFYKIKKELNRTLRTWHYNYVGQWPGILAHYYWGNDIEDNWQATGKGTIVNWIIATAIIRYNFHSPLPDKFPPENPPDINSIILNVACLGENNRDPTPDLKIHICNRASYEMVFSYVSRYNYHYWQSYSPGIDGTVAILNNNHIQVAMDRFPIYYVYRWQIDDQNKDKIIKSLQAQRPVIMYTG